MLEDHDAGVPYSCREGLCATCRTTVLAGAGDHRDSLLPAAERAANPEMMICVSRATSKILELDLWSRARDTAEVSQTERGMNQAYASDAVVMQRLFDHIDRRTTDLSDGPWREPVDNYRCPRRFEQELALLRRRYVPFCPSAALAQPGAYLAREAAGTPILATRGDDGVVRAFRNACRHRGNLLADGAGCARAFMCRYHGWTYTLEGALRHVPHEQGFPGLDKGERGLVALPVIERLGLVFIAQSQDAIWELDSMPELAAPGLKLERTEICEVEANWKVLAEGFLEGYHLRATHAETFYPRQYDNIAVVEHLGPHNRIAFPYRAIEKQRGLPADQRKPARALTFLYHLFPNAMVATFPEFRALVVLEPLTVERTRILTYSLSPCVGGREAELAAAMSFADRGIAEDREMARAIQRGMASGGNQYFEFGLFEGALSHFHRGLHAALGN